jgi:hypothetical protein
MFLCSFPRSLLLPFESVRLGRFVKSIDEPLEGYHKPASAKAPTSIMNEFNYTEHNQQGSSASFGSSLTALFSTAFSKRSGSEVRVEPRCCKAYALDNSDAWFDEAISREETKKWIERAAIRGSKIYMVVGIYTLTDTRFSRIYTGEQETQGQGTAPISLSLAAAGIVVPLAGLIDPSVQGTYSSSASNDTRIFAPREQICTVKYRKLKHKWLSSRVGENSKLSKTRQWSCIDGGRRDAYEDEDEDEEDMIEVDFEDAEKLGDERTAAESEEGVIYIRS